MTRRSIQLNIRATQDVVDAFRDEAQRRNLSLGDALGALLTLSQAGRSRGVWLSLPSDGEAALRAVAAARRVEPGVILGELISGTLKGQLLALAARLDPVDPLAEEAASSTGGGPHDGDAEDEDGDEVGIFTVFD